MARVVLITGGTSGIGASAARLFHANGYAVVCNYCTGDDAAGKFAAETGVSARKWDVADFAATQAGVGEIARTIGPVEILVNNAGITRDVTLHKMSRDQWQSVIDVDLGGVFNTSRAVIESMRTRKFGRIVNISSVNGQSGQFGQCNYAAAKAGIIGFTKALALESASRGITVNAVAPGYTNTAMVQAVPQAAMQAVLAGVPVGRLATPDEIARVILFLAAEESGFITGATFPVNGGKYMM